MEVCGSENNRLNSILQVKMKQKSKQRQQNYKLHENYMEFHVRADPTRNK